ncbi:serine carboxypeptidase-like 45 [Pyrus ussuriensis x Pyrus communis]|uniref:Serine carboxypeptidase-like 45 n=1 Tax=Pyrus ussuriensis x Pyrus communis TaxID=2448454 RepID=A0A5N5HQJ6_9ROSA|nr:serine carboxypeptidase-like 45 [Pyrus ussuriensis x Pyrus communis]
MMQAQRGSIVVVARVFTTVIQAFSTANSLQEADKITRLPGQPQVNFQQYAGYVTVDEKQGRSLFYYFVEAQTDPASKPLVLWLNGGPGCSSVGGAFIEHGPFQPSGDILLKKDFSWNREANMLYLESPAGVGFSYSANKSFYGFVNDDITARDNLEFLQRWFDEFPEYKNRDLFITGVSYAGHYVPQLAQLIIQSKLKFNLKAVAIGNPLLEFNTDINSRAEYWWSHGLISDATFANLTSVCNYSEIFRQERIRGGPLTPACDAVANQFEREVPGHLINRYDVTLDVCLSSVEAQSFQPRKTVKIDVCLVDEIVSYLNRPDVQEALHARITNWTICSNGGVLEYDMKNLEIPMLPVLGDLVKSGIRVLIYSGDQDSVIPLTSTRTLVSGLAKDLGLQTNVPYRVWFEEKQVAGWTQVYSDALSYATIRGAGHEAPISQPERSLLLFTSFLTGMPLPKA